MRRITFLVSGRVQGVGFRAGTAAVARRLRLAGFVQNREDGAVAGHAQGEPAAIDAFVAWLQRGPTFAHVVSLEVQDLPLDDRDRDSDFEVRR